MVKEYTSADIAIIAAKVTSGRAFGRSLQARRAKAEKAREAEEKRDQKQAQKEQQRAQKEAKLADRLIEKTINKERLYKKLNKGEKGELIEVLQNDRELRSSIIDVIDSLKGTYTLKHVAQMTAVYGTTMAVLVGLGLGISMFLGGAVTGATAIFVVAFGTLSIDSGYNFARTTGKFLSFLRETRTARTASQQKIADAIPSLGQTKPTLPAGTESTAFTGKTLTDKFPATGSGGVVEQDNKNRRLGSFKSAVAITQIR